MADKVDGSMIQFVGRQLAQIGDEVNFRYSAEFREIEAISAAIRARRRRHKRMRRYATIILQGGGLNIGVLAVFHLWLGYGRT